MRKNWPIAALALALIGSLAWGYTQNRQRAQLALRSENAYQQSFHRLQQSLTNIEERLATSLATASPRLLGQQMGDLKVYTSGAVENLAGLPLLNVKLEQTHGFLNRLFATADRLSRQAEQDQPVTTGDRGALEELYRQARFLNQELGQLADVVAGGTIRWADTEQVTQATADGNGTTPVLDGFGAIERGLQPPPGEEDATAPVPPPNDRPVADLGEPIAEGQAIRIATRFMDLPPTTQPQAQLLENTPVPLYLVSYQKSSGVPVTVAVSREGGHVLEVLDGREVGPVALDRDAVVARARRFLQRNGFPEAAVMAYDQYGHEGGVAVVTFAPVENGLTLFQQLIKVRVARDNGEILGYDARAHWFKQRPRSLAAPALTPAQARERVADGLQVAGGEGAVRLGVTDTDLTGETLAYRVLASRRVGPNQPSDHYEVYIDAHSGQEIQVRRLRASEVMP